MIPSLLAILLHPRGSLMNTKSERVYFLGGNTERVNATALHD